MNPLLFFEFMNANGEKEPLLFKEPIDIIVANNIDEVIPTLQNVQAAVHKGYYAAGYLSYEAAPAFEQAFQVNSDAKMPLLWFGIFKEPQYKSITSTSQFQTKEWIPQTDIASYNQSINQIKDYIEQGDTYQVNYTIRLKSEFDGDPIAYYNHLSTSQSANYSAFLNTGDYSILSASPELFFHLKDGKLTTKPMKGTVGRGTTDHEDTSNAEWLYHSEKNRAENVMIVDLLRNDLGRVAKAGTVQVPKLFTIEAYPTVFQMTSTVTAELEQDKNLIDIFKALFPCGSITGAPKVSTMNIINELETSPREVYCGTIGYITPEQEAIFNVPIRTVMIDNKSGTAQYGVGGGITWDSTNKEEYEEMLTKAKILTVNKEEFQLLETLGLENGEYIVLDNHLNRIKQSAAYFSYSISIEEIRKRLLEIAVTHAEGFWKVRLLVSKKGSFEVEIKESTNLNEPVSVSLSRSPVQKSDVFLYHKTTNRKVYEKSKEPFPNAFDVLLWNEDGEITEFTIGNVVVELDGKYYTPPVESGLLAGTYRQHLIDENIIEERKIKVEELKDCTNVWLINSVRKWVAVRLENLDFAKPLWQKP
ncbi:aminodeoxychorismate synthase component I [Ornithinibacillus sp. L9]|uniref:Aminodeoxychorismate synthase component I n=1 Tax=Ornithinibacillus caprae TaxID=2678566 RepID=A0A6N8FFM4_9BACI|nr:aminodeoxychorismate synthase component I [Ornithinibacillus caprae]MUK88313.1 aminodeoxychorismate synthase component I [Ornithinibacillus caprae]